MHYAILIERSYADDEVVAVHEVPYGLELPLGPQMVGSLDSFTVGVRAGVSSKDKKHHRTTPAWGPTALYSRQQNLEEWEEVQGKFVERMRQRIPDWTDERALPRIRHESIKAFYQHIGFDYKSRHYRDKDGKPIKYTTHYAKTT